MQLEYDYYPAATSIAEPLIVLHGLFGSSTNWRNICKHLSAQRTIYALDLRNHGASKHTDSMTLAEMAADIFEFISAQQLPACAILGHSLGGKVAMQSALTRPEQFTRLIVADIAPKFYPPRHDDIFAAVDMLDNSHFDSRQQADALIKSILPDQAMRLFLLSNLRRDDNGTFDWRINMHAIRANYAAISSAPEPPTVDAHYSGTTLFIRGDRSPYIKDEDFAVIHKLFPAAQLETIADCGHWVHTEQPEEFLRIVKKFLK